MNMEYYNKTNSEKSFPEQIILLILSFPYVIDLACGIICLKYPQFLENLQKNNKIFEMYSNKIAEAKINNIKERFFN